MGRSKWFFLSFMRDMAFWREGARKINLDLDRLTQQNRFHFIDGLTALHLPPPTSPTPKPNTHTTPSRPHPANPLPNPHRAITTLTTANQTPNLNPKPILLIDNLDLLLATSPSPTISTALSSLLLTTTRQSVHSTILTLSIDSPLLPSSPSPPTPLSSHTSHFLLTQAHAASQILSTRLLDTGAARDVSGVLRITAGGSGDADADALEERELLYFVGGDGG
ncbi:hypothetical protein EYC84_006096 [Monilinia fructicola]|uniref:Elongator complex protein 5 n=1 Tax=Monilinia fructicola TaxID=38448 RepID=A0A5M9K307_MONFR|nr:hypothetical protein EYC84_006096 [Monilinia fructicola]